MNFPVFDLGIIDYYSAWQAQKRIFNQVESAVLDSALLVCRHNPVITLGRSSDKKNILVDRDALAKRGIDLYEVERGGDVTYHGLGQITAYPIIKLHYFKKDIHWFLRRLEDSVIDFLSAFGVEAQRKPGFTGVWAGDKKIASLGISVRRWISFHGLSINLESSDLWGFSLIRPCGLDVEMTCLEKELGQKVDISAAKESWINKFFKILDA